MKKDTKAIQLTEFVSKFIPCGWKEPIGAVRYAHHFEWYEIEAIEAWFASQPSVETGRATLLACPKCSKEIEPVYQCEQCGHTWPPAPYLNVMPSGRGGIK